MFLVIKRKKIFVAILVFIIAVLSLGAVGVSLSETGLLQKRLIPIYFVETDKKEVALTFDCAWGADKTRDIMSMIEKAGYKCTFFATGFWIDANPELVKEIHSRGHQVANHSESHPHLNKLDEEAVLNEINSVNDKIEALIGVKPTCFRAPFGEYDNRLINALLEQKMLCIQWSIDSLDWKGISGKEITERVVGKVKSGDIILFHNNSDHVLEALPLILSAIKNKGLNAVRVDELVYFENYTINPDGKQIKNS